MHKLEVKMKKLKVKTRKINIKTIKFDEKIKKNLMQKWKKFEEKIKNKPKKMVWRRQTSKNKWKTYVFYACETFDLQPGLQSTIFPPLFCFCLS